MPQRRPVFSMISTLVHFLNDYFSSALTALMAKTQETAMTRPSLARAASRRELLAAGGSLLLGSPGLVFGQSGDSLKIGSARAMTGLVASSFAPLYLGVKIAVDEINAAGGILGRKLDIVEADDESSPAKEPAVMRRLLDGGALAILGPVGSSHTLSAVATTTASKIIHAGGGWTEELADGRKYPYHYQFTYNTGHQGDAIARHIVDNLKLKKVGILQENTALGEAGAAATTRALKRLGIEPVAVETYPVTATDLKVYLTKIRSAGADALVLWNSLAQGVLLTAAGLQALKYYPALLGGNSMFSNTVLDNAAPEVLKLASATLLKTMTYSATEPAGPRQVAHAKKVLTYPEAKTWQINAAISPFFSPDNHCALTGEQMVMATLSSGRDPRSLGVFRELT